MSKNLYQAAAENDLQTLRDSSDVNAPDPETGWTALHHAAEHNSSQAARLLLEQGADPNALNQEGESPLHLAAGAEVISVLLSWGANLDLLDGSGTTARDRILQDSASNIFTTLGSETYQLLRAAQSQKLAVKATYHQKEREFSVIQLGWTERKERCFALQHSPEEGLRCFEVAEIEGASISDQQARATREHKPCVQIVDQPLQS